MDRTIKDATVRRSHHDTHEQFGAHPQLFLDAYTYARRPKTLDLYRAPGGGWEAAPR